MQSFYMTLFACFAVTFAALAFLPRWRWLLPTTVIALGLCIWIIFDLLQGGGRGAVFAVPMVAAAALGVVSGFMAGAAILWTRGERRAVPQNPKHKVVSYVILAALICWEAANFTGFSWTHF